MYKYKLNIVLLFIYLLIYDCSSNFSNQKDLTASICLKEKNKDKCFLTLFSFDGPLPEAIENQNSTEIDRILSINDDKELTILCNELYKQHEEEIIQTHILYILWRNSAPCICDYCESSIKMDNKDKEDCEDYYKRFKCKEGKDYINYRRKLKFGICPKSKEKEPKP